MSRRQPEGTRLISRSDDRPDTYTYGAIKREPSFLAAPSKYLWAKRDFVLITVVLVTALVLIAVTLSLGLPRITVNRARHLNATMSPSTSPLPPLEQAVFGTESSGVTVEKYIGALLRSSGRLNFQISPF